MVLCLKALTRISIPEPNRVNGSFEYASIVGTYYSIHGYERVTKTRPGLLGGCVCVCVCVSGIRHIASQWRIQNVNHVI